MLHLRPTTALIQTADSFSNSGYLASAKSYLPGMGQVSDAASEGTGKAQQGLGAAGYASFLLHLSEPSL